MPTEPHERRESDHLPHPEEHPPAPAEGRPPHAEAPRGGWFARFLAAVEWLGNLLPHPVTLFALFALGVVVAPGSRRGLGLSVEDPRPGRGRGASPSAAS
jgi:aminobenzoyl-glutamate transport protein